MALKASSSGVGSAPVVAPAPAARRVAAPSAASGKSGRAAAAAAASRIADGSDDDGDSDYDEIMSPAPPRGRARASPSAAGRVAFGRSVPPLPATGGVTPTAKKAAPKRKPRGAYAFMHACTAHTVLVLVHEACAECARLPYK